MGRGRAEGSEWGNGYMAKGNNTGVLQKVGRQGRAWGIRLGRHTGQAMGMGQQGTKRWQVGSR